MLLVVVPHARIMRYRYKLLRFRERTMQQVVSTVAEHLLLELQLKRKVRNISIRRVIAADLAISIRFNRYCSFHIASVGSLSLK